jgi:Undecaprenyl-phosphate glucose phosphotransferase
MSQYSDFPEVIRGSIYARIRFISYRTIGKCVVILDYALIIIASLAAGYGYHLIFLNKIADFGPYFGIGNVSAIIFVILSHGLYRPSYLNSFMIQIRSILFNWIVLILILTLMLFLLKIGASLSRGALSIFSLIGLGLLVASRLVVCTKLNDALERGTFVGYPALIIGDREGLQRLTGLHILQRFGAREIGRFELPSANGQQFNLAGIDNAIEAARTYDVEGILLALNWGNGRLRNLVCERLQALPLPVLLLPDQSISPLLSRPLRQLGTDFAVEIQRAPLSPPELLLKRTLDLLLGGVALVGLAPLLAVVSLLIKLDSRGPVIFRQRRKGFNGREFAIYKFRTMGVLENGDVISQAKRNDVRITRVGRVLRATSIDELPQLINVLRGQMSLVGPRPHAVAHDNGYAEIIANYAFRQHVKPGITGWAQVHGLRGETSQLELMKQRVAFDLWYIKNWSPLLDLKIIMLTCVELVRGQNAY